MSTGATGKRAYRSPFYWQRWDKGNLNRQDAKNAKIRKRKEETRGISLLLLHYPSPWRAWRLGGSILD
jgi:hypothetical protein